MRRQAAAEGEAVHRVHNQRGAVERGFVHAGRTAAGSVIDAVAALRLGALEHGDRNARLLHQNRERIAVAAVVAAAADDDRRRKIDAERLNPPVDGGCGVAHQRERGDAAVDGAPVERADFLLGQNKLAILHFSSTSFPRLSDSILAQPASNCNSCPRYRP